MADDLQQIEDWLKPLLRGLTPANKKHLMRSIGLGLRKRQQARIRSQINPDGTPYEPRQSRQQRRGGRIRRRGQMFRKLRQARHMKVISSVDGVAVGFGGRAAAIAKIHQRGLLARVAPDGPLYDYPIRQLLGFSDDDRLWILEQVIDAIGVK